MKKNKKAILGMLIAIVISTGFMCGNDKKAGENINKQQWAAACWYYGNHAESTCGEAVGKSLGAFFGGGAAEIFSLGIATGGTGLAAAACWGVVVCS